MDIEQLIIAITNYIPKLIAALPVVGGIILVTFLLNLALGRGMMLIARGTSLTEATLQPFVRIFRWVFRAIALVLILGVFGFEISGLWAMISTVLGLVAIGFVAVWSLLSNISSTAIILFLEPFEVGDDIEFAGEPVAGRVVNLNLFFTTLLTHDGRVTQIPNNLFFQKVVKRKANAHIVSLANQLNTRGNATVELPPPPAVTAPVKPPEADPLLSMPDPASMNIPTPKR